MDVEDCTAKPWHPVADHKEVITQVKFKVQENASHQRESRHFTDANRERLPSNIEGTKWEFLLATPLSEEARLMTDKLLHIAENNIPKRLVRIMKFMHPWLTEDGRKQ